MDHALQECPRRHHDGGGGYIPSGGGPNPGNGAGCIEDQILDAVGLDIQSGLFIEQRLDGLSVELAVGLGAGALNRRTLGPVEDAELNAGTVRGAGHDAVQGIDLAHQLPLGQAADGRVA